MNREEYLRQLQKYLKRLPKEDYDSAMEYFTEYFDEAGPEGEQAVIEQLGSPKQAAGELLVNMLGEKTGKTQTGKARKTENKTTSIGHIILIAVLAICAAPIGIPLALTAILLVLVAVLVFAIGILCILLFGLSGALIGGKLILVGFASLPASLSGMLLLVGMGLLILGIGILLCVFAVYLCRWIGLGLIYLAQKLIHRNGGTYHE